MKLLLYSHYFAPSIGGVETIVLSLARGLAELRAAGGARELEVALATRTAREKFDDSSLPFPVVRRAGFWELLRLVRRADIVHLAGPALLPLALGLLLRKPVVIEHLNPASPHLIYGLIGMKLFFYYMYKTKTWSAFDWLRTKGKGYRITDGDGVSYSYTLTIPLTYSLPGRID